MTLKVGLVWVCDLVVGFTLTYGLQPLSLGLRLSSRLNFDLWVATLKVGLVWVCDLVVGFILTYGLRP